MGKTTKRDTKTASSSLYDDEESIKHLIKSLDYLTKDGECFRCFVRSSNSSITDLLKKLKWFDGTITPYKPKQKEMKKYIFNILKFVSKCQQ